MVAFIFTSG